MQRWQREVLNRGDTCHLGRHLTCASQDAPSGIRAIAEELSVRFCGVFMLFTDLSLHDLEFGADVGIVDITVRMQSGKVTKAFFWSAVVDKPAWAFGKGVNERDKSNGWNHLEAETALRQYLMSSTSLGVLTGFAIERSCRYLPSE